MSTGTNNFIQFNHKEVLSKLKTLAEQKEVVNVWTKGGKSHIYRVFEVQFIKRKDGGFVFISFFSEGKEADESILDKRVFLSFSLDDIDYFSEGLIQTGEDSERLILRLDKEVYRSENRINERLLTFPDHQVYAYFRMPDDIFHQTNQALSESDSEDMAFDYKLQRKKKLLEELAKKTDDIKNLVGFRALDVGRSGVAFTVGKSEENYFDQNKKYSFKMLFNGDLFEVSNSKLVYKVNFSNHNGDGVTYKIGISFNPISELTQKIMEAIHQNKDMDSAQKDFEKFSEL